MLVGVWGSGKQSLIRLATTIIDNQVFQITPSRTYQTTDFLTDLRESYRPTGVSNKPIAFVFTIMKLKQTVSWNISTIFWLQEH
jgi:dynein heavy chain